MKISHFSTDDWKNDHPTGEILFQHLLRGDPASNDNFMYIIGCQVADFWMPRHRHNFDQIRLPLRGPMNLGEKLTLGEGQVGYFAEGLPYGPQNDPLGRAQPGERLQLVLQFAGASGYGFMSIEQRRQARDELAQIGTFEGPNFRWPDGRVEWALSAIWHQVFGEKLKYAKPRYKDVVIADPRNFAWKPVPRTNGTDNKFLGSFSERGVWAEMVRIRAGATWSSSDAIARRLLVVLKGAGAVGGEEVKYLTGIQSEPEEPLQIRATEEMEIFLVGLPPVIRAPDGEIAYDHEELPAEEATA
jgi:hypothetical protein